MTYRFSSTKWTIFPIVHFVVLNIATLPPLKFVKFSIFVEIFLYTTQKSNHNETLNLFHYFSPMHIYNFG